MRSIMATGIGIALALALGGCSVMGVATRKDMDELARRDLSSTEQIETRLDNLEDGLRELTQDAEAAQQGLAQRLATMERDQQSLLESVNLSRNKLAELTTRLQEMLERVEGVQGDVDQAVSRSELASARSDRAMQYYVEALAKERDHLVSRLEVLNGELDEWDRRNPTAHGSEKEQASRPEPEIVRESSAPAAPPAAPPEATVQESQPPAPEQAARIRIEPAPRAQIRPEEPAEPDQPATPAAPERTESGIKLKSVPRRPAGPPLAAPAPADTSR